jgi:hypothetical protein
MIACARQNAPRVGETEVCALTYWIAPTEVSTDRAVTDAEARFLTDRILNSGLRHVPSLSAIALCLSGYQ